MRAGTGSRGAWFLALALAAGQAVAAGEGGTGTGAQRAAEEIARQGQEIIERHGADAALLQEPAAAPEPAAPPLPAGDGTIRLYVSLGMPPGTLAGAADLARRNPRVLLVLRGAPPGHTIQRVVEVLREAGGAWELPGARSTPNAVIDPPAFRREGIGQVPVMVLGEGEEAVRVGGLLDADWLEAQARAGRRGDLGQQGPLYAITEDDMEERLRQALAALDVAAMQRQARERALAQVPMFELPQARRERTRTLDPSVTAQEDVLAPDGTVAIRRGARANPLQVAPFRTRMIIFDPTVPAQVDFALAQGAQAPQGDVLYLASRLVPPTWDAYAALAARLGGRPRLLTEQVRARFGVEALPTVIDPGAERFTIREHPPGGATATDVQEGREDADAHPQGR